jgi:ferrochelatase
MPPFSEHPLFLEAMTDRVRAALALLPGARVVFTAHSVPISMADSSPYVQQLEAASRRVAETLGARDRKLVYQSRSGPPTQPWLGPDICDYLRESPCDTIAPIGFHRITWK